MENANRTVLFRAWVPAEYLVLDGEDFKASAALVPGTGCWGELVNKGVFHLWGNSYVESANGIFYFTIAIVETITGEVYEVLPQNLKFTT